MTIAIACVLLGGCTAPPATVGAEKLAPVPPPKIKTDPAQAKRVLLVINDSSAASREVGEFYRVQRMIPNENVVRIKAPDQKDLQRFDFTNMIEKPIREKLKATKNPIDFIVMTKGVPLIVHWGSYSIDGQIACMDMDFEPIKNPTPEEIKRCLNPYFNKKEAFSKAKYGFYLVTRIDGFTVEDAKKLVTNSLSAKPLKGPFLFDADPTRFENGYKIMSDSLARAIYQLKDKGYDVKEDPSNGFMGSAAPLAGYASWGSNDRKFDRTVYRSLKFLPGALAETFVSTSGRSFVKDEGGQSQIGDLIAGGVTGVKGYVSEPYTFALGHPDIIFDRYTSGYNLAESFYMGSLVLKWKDIVIGDPLCSPYAKK